jgi:hypothetical protein
MYVVSKLLLDTRMNNATQVGGHRVRVWEKENESKPLKDCDRHYICPAKLEPTGASKSVFHQLAVIATANSLCHQASTEFGV